MEKRKGPWLKCVLITFFGGPVLHVLETYSAWFQNLTLMKHTSERLKNQKQIGLDTRAMFAKDMIHMILQGDTLLKQLRTLK
ncbi:hypothetical protein OUZ56_010303 [Daphnia magna]|uniref:Uncharacterized protein n=1 Tax=Daphnia magna TaxID=35525 RepID=A0ABR0AI94_9CRUS|nr:hypothetical protein OUZ56_010303 [Daphnia magna]